MREYLLSWVLGCPARRGGRREKPAWRDIAALLEDVIAHSGSLGLLIPGAKSGVYNLDIFSESGRFVAGLVEIGKDNVRSFYYPNADETMVEIMGEMWDGRLVSSDPDMVRRAFREFFDTGDVSRELLT